jgi:TPR repeat protein
MGCIIMTMKRISEYALAAAIVLVLSIAGPVVAGPYEDGVAADMRGDYATGLQLLRPLAEQDDARAQASLGAMYGLGHGVPEDNAAAANWYRKAANQGYAQAQLTLADRGYAEAQSTLGLLYRSGEGVPQDYVLAHMWFNLAAARGKQEAASHRDSISERMTAGQIAEAQKLAREWKPK